MTCYAAAAVVHSLAYSRLPGSVEWVTILLMVMLWHVYLLACGWIYAFFSPPSTFHDSTTYSSLCLFLFLADLGPGDQQLSRCMILTGGRSLAPPLRPPPFALKYEILDYGTRYL